MGSVRLGPRTMARRVHTPPVNRRCLAVNHPFEGQYDGSKSSFDLHFPWIIVEGEIV